MGSDHKNHEKMGRRGETVVGRIEDQGIRIPGYQDIMRYWGNSEENQCEFEWQLLRFQISHFGLQIGEEKIRRSGDLGSRK